MSSISINGLCPTNALSQWLLGTALNIPANGRRNRIRYRVLRLIRQLRLTFSDPLVTFSLDGFRLCLPLSHELPFYRRAFPEYSSNLGRVGYHVAQKYPDASIIDIGSNVGDSAAILRTSCSQPILCIEGEARFFDCLSHNTRSLPDIEREQTFVGAGGDTVAKIFTHQGNAEIRLGSGPGSASICTLSEVLTRHPRFATARFIKLDAEGFDCRIIVAEPQLIARNKPVLFFEYYPHASKLAGYDPFPVFPFLAGLGYSTLLIYQNIGNYFATIKLDQLCSLEDLHYFLSDLGGFCDLVAFHTQDLDIALQIRFAEHADREKRLNQWQ
jgi:FkbM family methyltransferase